MGSDLFSALREVLKKHYYEKFELFIRNSYSREPVKVFLIMCWKHRPKQLKHKIRMLYFRRGETRAVKKLKNVDHWLLHGVKYIFQFPRMLQ